MSALHAVNEQHYSAPDATERAEALNATEAFIRRFVVVSQAQSTTTTLWLAHTHCIEAFDCTPYLAITSEQKRSGKRLHVETPVPTPDGWATMGELAIGDTVLDDQGRPCQVTWVSPIVDAPSLTVCFGDGERLIADPEHQWLTWDDNARNFGGKSAVRTTAEIADSIQTWRTPVRANHSIPHARPLDLPERDLPIDPYLLGFWLGDGSSAAAEITIADEDAPYVLGRFRQAGQPISTARRSPTSGHSCATYGMSDGVHRGKAPNNPSLSARLKRLNLLKNKHVPPVYLRASRHQRLALLQGLMDSDGHNNGRQAEFAVTNEALADGLYELVVSLGMKASKNKRPAKLYGVEYGTSYRITFTPLLPAFGLPRKAQAWTTLTGSVTHKYQRGHRYIRSVEEGPIVPMRCITVDSPSSLYLAGRGMIPTHNTRALEVLELLARKPLRTSDMTEAALFHMLSNGASTLLLDECDTIFKSRKSNEGMRALLNAGYRRGSPIRRMKGGQLESYDVFCPKVLAGIGSLPDTVMDRSVVIKLERKRPAEDVERFRHADAATDASYVHAKLHRCFHPLAENVEWLQRLAVARPHLPEWLNDRAQDSWECLLAIAEAVGGGWSERAVRATQELSAEPVTIR